MVADTPALSKLDAHGFAWHCGACVRHSLYLPLSDFFPGLGTLPCNTKRSHTQNKRVIGFRVVVLVLGSHTENKRVAGLWVQGLGFRV